MLGALRSSVFARSTAGIFSKSQTLTNSVLPTANVGVRNFSSFFNADKEVLSPEQQREKDMLIRELTKRLSGPLAGPNGELPTGSNRPIAIEVDGPSHFYVNSTKYTSYTKLKHRLLTRMGYKVLHVPYFEWRRLRSASEREQYMRLKLLEEPTEWLDPEDEAYFQQRVDYLRQQQARLGEVADQIAAAQQKEETKKVAGQ